MVCANKAMIDCATGRSSELRLKVGRLMIYVLYIIYGVKLLSVKMLYRIMSN